MAEVWKPSLLYKYRDWRKYKLSIACISQKYKIQDLEKLRQKALDADDLATFGKLDRQISKRQKNLKAMEAKCGRLSLKLSKEEAQVAVKAMSKAFGPRTKTAKSRLMK